MPATGNSKKAKKKLIVISAPSGAGKTTICSALLQRDKRLAESISVTTRQPRGSEKEGVDYYFITEKQFQRDQKLNRFLEWAKVHDYFYGTLKKEIKNKTAAGFDVLLNIDVQGGLAVKRQMPEAVLIFLAPPSMNVLKKRLTGRGTDSRDVINQRLLNAKQEMKQSNRYDYLVVNDKLDQAIQNIETIIRAERLKIK